MKTDLYLHSEDCNLLTNELRHLIEDSIDKVFQPYKVLLEQQKQISIFFNHGIEGIKNQFSQEQEKDNFNPILWVYSLIQKDDSLRYPHRKILEYLAKQYNYDKKEFKEVNYSKIVTECRLGRNMAKGYLNFLVNKGLVNQRNSGNLVLYDLMVEFFHV